MAIVFGFLKSFALVLSTGLGLSLAALLFKPVRKGSEQSLGAVLLLSLVLSFWSGFAYVQQALWPPFPPVDSGHWVIWFLIPFTGLALLQNHFRLAWWFRLSYRLLSGGALVFLVSAPLREYSWSSGYSLLFIFTVACFYLIYGEFLDGLSQKYLDEEAYLFPLLMGLMAVSSAVLFLIASSAWFQQQAVFLALSLAVPLGLMIWRSDIQAHRGFLSLGSYLLLGLWLQVWLFAEANAWGLGILGTPLILWTLKLPQLKAHPLGRKLLCGALALFWCIAVILWVWQTTPQPEIYTG